MPFCPKCGRQLQAGEVCECQSAAQSQAQPIPSDGGQSKPLFNPDSLNKVNEKLGSFAETSGKKISELAGEGKEKYQEIKKDPKKFRILLIAAAVIVILILVLIIRGCSGGSKGGAMQPIDRLVDEINKGEKADVVALNTAFHTKSFRDLTEDIYALAGDEAEDEADEMKEKFEDMTDEIGKWKLSFETTDKEQLSDDDLEEYQDEIREVWEDKLESMVDGYEDADPDEIEALAEMLDVSTKDVKKLLNSVISYAKTFKKATVSDGYKVRGSFILADKKGKEIDSTNKVTLYVLKINGEWAVYAAKDNDTFSFKGPKDEDYNLSDYRFLTQFMNIPYKQVMSRVSIF